MTEVITLKIGTLIDIIQNQAKDSRQEIKRRGYSQTSSNIPGELNTTPRAFHQNQCWNAMHNCTRCKADCSDREGQP